MYMFLQQKSELQITAVVCMYWFEYLITPSHSAYFAFSLYRSAHQMVFHPTQILYFCAFSLLFNAPYTISRILPFFFTCKKHWIMAILTTLLIVGCIQNYTFAHPYLLADNR